jgi:hypothetical protein
MPSDHNNVWASTPATGEEEELTTPTGQTCRAKKMSIESMISEGLLVEADAITAMVAKHMKKVRPGGKQPKKGTEAVDALDVPSLMKDPKAVTEMITMIDRLLPHVVVSPPVRLHYTETKVGKTTVRKTLSEEDRAEIREQVPGTVFTDQIGLEDKMFLFDWAAGGLGSMLAFRE